ncbi:MAG: hypothetical protein HF308_15350 [Ignavibacteria bacterium]|jgi:hypothetical protein|nr:hypothetical protein [Ignavibacteria bacterium]MCU7525854.1 hypothetical protein [Ignavibacteria bacterium]
MGRNVEGLKKALTNISGKDVVGETKGEVYNNFNLHYVDVKLALVIKNAAGQVVATPTVAVALGETAVNAGTDGKYPVKMGTYAVSVSKTGYESASVNVEITYDDAKAETKEVIVVLHEPCDVTFAVKDALGAAVDTPTITVTKDATPVTATNGVYACGKGTYSYSVAKTGYTTAEGTFTIADADLDTAKEIAVELAAA